MAFDTPSIGSLLWLSDSSQDLYGYKQMARAIIGCVSVYLLWRFWKFSLTPYFYPDEPKELPYWIPGKSLFRKLKLLLNILYD